MLLQIIICISSAISIWGFIENKQKLACVVGLIGQPLWVYTSFINKEWGIVAVSVWFTVYYIKGVWKYSSPPKKTPKIVCLCGSTKFKNAYAIANKAETLAGNIVLSVGVFGYFEEAPMEENTKKLLDKLHLEKIDLSHEILVINVNNYIGSSTMKEIKYAQSTGKPVRYMFSNSSRGTVKNEL